MCTFTTTSTPGSCAPFSDDMESGTSSWTTMLSSGSNDWALDGRYTHSGGNAWYSSDENIIKDDYLKTTSIDLTGARSATLSFWHTYEMENGYDGCVIEISTDGGSSFSDLGGDLTSGGYTGFISTDYSSPIGGRQAWTGGTLGTMSEVSVDLTPYAGNQIILRFRIACDSDTASQGWYIDDVTVSTTSCTNTSPTPVSTTYTLTYTAGAGGSIIWLMNGAGLGSVANTTAVSPTSGWAIR